MRPISAWVLLGVSVIGLVLFVGCGGDDDGGVKVSIQVDVSPETATVGTGQTLQITAVVIQGGSDNVEWYVDDILGGNTTVGTVTQANPTTYTAPAALPDPVTVVIKAVSTEDTTKFDTCTITLTQNVVVSVTPDSWTLNTSSTLNITATVSGGTTNEVEWYVDDILGGNATVGTVTQANPTTYTAPAALPDPVTVVVRAVSTEDDSKSDSCTITLTQDIVVNVTPASGTIGTSSTFHITADVAGGATNEVQWYVNDVLSGNVIVGTVTQANPTTYTAPNSVPSPATVVVKAISTEDASRYDSCLVTVTEPPDISVDVSPEREEVEVSESASITATVTGGTTGDVMWYVDGIVGGNSAVGTVTQTNPATYTAPDEVPSPDSVMVVAVSQEDVSEADTCVIKITMTTIHVDAATGSDDAGTGSAGSPVKTITHGLDIADDGATVLVAPGVYDEALGEEFPIVVRSGKKLVGENWETCVIRGHSEVSSYRPAVTVYQTNSAFRKFTVEEGPVVENIWDIAIFLGNTAVDCLVDSVRCFERARYSVLRFEGSRNTIVQNCVFDVRAISEVDVGMNRCMEVINDDQGCVLRNCTIAGFHNGGSGYGIRMSGNSDMRIEGCSIEDNGYGVYLCCNNNETNNPVPDLGGGARGSTGGNTIRNNSTCGLFSYSTADIYAKYNTWTNDPPVEGEDYCIGETGDIIVE